jgi:hypothetical protein
MAEDYPDDSFQQVADNDAFEVEDFEQDDIDGGLRDDVLTTFSDNFY